MACVLPVPCCLSRFLVEFFFIMFFIMSISSGDDGPFWSLGGPAQRQSFAQGGRGGLRVVVWLSWLPMRMTLFMLLSCARGKMGLGFS